MEYFFAPQNSGRDFKDCTCLEDSHTPQENYSISEEDRWKKKINASILYTTITYIYNYSVPSIWGLFGSWDTFTVNFLFGVSRANPCPILRIRGKKDSGFEGHFCGFLRIRNGVSFWGPHKLSHTDPARGGPSSSQHRWIVCNTWECESKKRRKRKQKKKRVSGEGGWKEKMLANELYVSGMKRWGHQGGGGMWITDIGWGPPEASNFFCDLLCKVDLNRPSAKQQNSFWFPPVLSVSLVPAGNLVGKIRVTL